MRNSRNVPKRRQGGELAAQLRQLDLDDKNYGRAYRRQTGGAPPEGNFELPSAFTGWRGCFYGVRNVQLPASRTICVRIASSTIS